MNVSLLQPIYETDASVASVYLDTTRAVEAAPHQIELRWRALRDELANDGADGDTLEAIDKVVGQDVGVPGCHGQAVFASAGRVLLNWPLSAPPVPDTAAWGLPDPLPLLRDLSQVVPYVVVVADRVGADIRAYGPWGEDRGEHSVDGDTLHIQKVQAGGWAHSHFQRRAENLWSANAGQVAADVDRLVRRLRPQIVVVAGDVRACEALRDQLSEESRGLVVEIQAGGRGAGSSEESLDEAVRQAVTEVAERGIQRVLKDFAEQRGQGGRATHGLAETARALSLAQVDTLLISEDGPTGSLWVGSEPGQVADSEDQVRQLGAGTPRRVPAVAALIRAAWATDAAAVVVPQPRAPQGGVGALLRFEI